MKLKEDLAMELYKVTTTSMHLWDTDISQDLQKSSWETFLKYRRAIKFDLI